MEVHFTREQLARVAQLTDADVARVNECRGAHNKLGFACQLCYVRLFNRFSAQHAVILDELATFVVMQLDIPRERLADYATQQATFSLHQQAIREYLQVEKFSQQTELLLRGYLLQQARQIQATDSLLLKATEFLKERKVLNPSDDTIGRLIQTEREKARTASYTEVTRIITPEIRATLDDLLVVDGLYSKLYQIKEVPKNPRPQA